MDTGPIKPYGVNMINIMDDPMAVFTALVLICAFGLIFKQREPRK